MIFLPEVSTTPNLEPPRDAGLRAPGRRRAARALPPARARVRLHDRRRRADDPRARRPQHVLRLRAGRRGAPARQGPADDVGERVLRAGPRRRASMQTGRRADRLRQRLRVGALRAPPSGCAAACGCVAGGMCFPSFPTWTSTKPYFWNREHATMLQLARETPGRMARVRRRPGRASLARRRRRDGDAVAAGRAVADDHASARRMITDARRRDPRAAGLRGRRGLRLRRRRAGPSPQPLDPVPPRFWMTTLPVSVQLIWHVANTHGRAKYLAMKALHRHPWQADPAYGQRPAGRHPGRADGRRACTSRRPEPRALASPPCRGRGPSWAS